MTNIRDRSREVAEHIINLFGFRVDPLAVAPHIESAMLEAVLINNKKAIRRLRGKK